MSHTKTNEMNGPLGSTHWPHPNQVGNMPEPHEKTYRIHIQAMKKLQMSHSKATQEPCLSPN